MNDAILLLRATLALWGDALRDSARALASRPWLVLVPPLYSVGLGAVGALAAPLGFAGGLLLYLAVAACLSSFLDLVDGAVRNEKLGVEEVLPGFGRHVWSIVNVLFLLWVIQLLLGLITEQNPGLAWLALAVDAGIFVACNPLPELVYQGSRAGLAMVDDAVQFTRDNAAEWLLPVALLLAPVFLIDVRSGFVAMAEMGPTTALALVSQVLGMLLPAMGSAGQIVVPLAASVVLVWAMLFRGFLFRSLTRSGRRQRIFAARMRGR